MKKDTLTLLGCSGSLAFMILTANAAQAGTVSPQYTGFAGSTKTSTSTVNATQSPESNQTATLDPASDTIGDMAIAKFKCDCMACRNAVIQLIRAGELALP